MASRAPKTTRRQALTEAAIDYAISSGADLWEASGEDAEQFADMAIDSTLDALGRPGEDSDSLDRAEVVRAIRVEFDPDFEAEAKTATVDTDLPPSKLDVLAALQARSRRALNA